MNDLKINESKVNVSIDSSYSRIREINIAFNLPKPKITIASELVFLSDGEEKKTVLDSFLYKEIDGNEQIAILNADASIDYLTNFNNIYRMLWSIYAAMLKEKEQADLSSSNANKKE